MMTPEGIEIKPRYAAEELPHLGYVAGLPPYLRGPYTTM